MDENNNNNKKRKKWQNLENHETIRKPLSKNRGMRTSGDTIKCLYNRGPTQIFFTLISKIKHFI